MEAHDHEERQRRDGRRGSGRKNDDGRDRRVGVGVVTGGGAGAAWMTLLAAEVADAIGINPRRLEPTDVSDGRWVIFGGQGAARTAWIWGPTTSWSQRLGGSLELEVTRSALTLGF